MLHAKTMAYPRFRDRLHLQELRRYTLSLGMQRDSLVKFLKPTVNNEGDAYFSIASIYEMLDNKTANQVLHRTFNIYSAEYNTQVIRKSLSLVMNRRLSFVELQEVRSLFEAYECEDMEGMPASEHTIFRILKHCGRSIAPLQLQHQLKKMRDYVDGVGRLQFYEFLDIIPLTTYIKDIEIQTELNNGTAKDGQKLYKIDNFHNFLYTHEDKVKKQLDRDYRHIISQAPYSEQEPKKRGREKLIEHTKQVQLEQESRISYQALKDAVRQSNNIISLSRGGQMLRKSPSRGSSMASLRTSMKNVSCEEPETKEEKPKVLLEPLILQKDIAKQDALMEDLEWEMINNTEKYKVSVKKKLDELKNRKKYRENCNIWSQPPSTAPRQRTADIFTVRPSRPSTVTDAFDLYSTFDEENSFKTRMTSSGTIDMVDDSDIVSVEPPVFRDITLDPDYQARKQVLLERVKLIKQGKRLVDL